MKLKDIKPDMIIVDNYGSEETVLKVEEDTIITYMDEYHTIDGRSKNHSDCSIQKVYLTAIQLEDAIKEQKNENN
jgi:hypothetical protein